MAPLRNFLNALLAFQHLSFSLSAPTSQKPTATLDSGVIVGTTTSLPSSSVTVNKFLGIPFAAPAERFVEPRSPKKWSGTLDTTKPKAACIQAFICR